MLPNVFNIIAATCKFVHMEGRKEGRILVNISELQTDRRLFSGKHIHTHWLQNTEHTHTHTHTHTWTFPACRWFKQVLLDGNLEMDLKVIKLEKQCRYDVLSSTKYILQLFSSNIQELDFQRFPFPFSLPLVSTRKPLRREREREREREMQASRPESFAAHFQMVICLNQSKLRECK